MPALFALGLHDALVEARRRLHPDDTVVAFLDDLYVITTWERALPALTRGWSKHVAEVIKS